MRRLPESTLFPYTTLFRSICCTRTASATTCCCMTFVWISYALSACEIQTNVMQRSEEHTSELQSQSNLVCRLLLEKKNNMMVAKGLYYDPTLHRYIEPYMD